MKFDWLSTDELLQYTKYEWKGKATKYPGDTHIIMCLPLASSYPMPSFLLVTMPFTGPRIWLLCTSECRGAHIPTHWWESSHLSSRFGCKVVAGMDGEVGLQASWEITNIFSTLRPDVESTPDFHGCTWVIDIMFWCAQQQSMHFYSWLCCSWDRDARMPPVWTFPCSSLPVLAPSIEFWQWWRFQCISLRFGWWCGWCSRDPPSHSQ